jgi:hypothetical protein
MEQLAALEVQNLGGKLLKIMQGKVFVSCSAPFDITKLRLVERVLVLVYICEHAKALEADRTGASPLNARRVDDGLNLATLIEGLLRLEDQGWYNAVNKWTLFHPHLSDHKIGVFSERNFDHQQLPFAQPAETDQLERFRERVINGTNSQSSLHDNASDDISTEQLKQSEVLTASAAGECEGAIDVRCIPCRLNCKLRGQMRNLSRIFIVKTIQDRLAALRPTCLRCETSLHRMNDLVL